MDILDIGVEDDETGEENEDEDEDEEDETGEENEVEEEDEEDETGEENEEDAIARPGTWTMQVRWLLLVAMSTILLSHQAT